MPTVLLLVMPEPTKFRLLTTTPAEFEKYFRDEAERWTRVYKESGIKLD